MPPAPEQPNLNAAFYGPSIPPNSNSKSKSKSYHRPGRSRGGGGGGNCNPLTCCFSCICSCILNLICQILITIAVFLAIIALIFWFIFRPNVPKFHVSDATLTRFNLSDSNDSNTLSYNLAVNMTFRNPNRRLGIYYDYISAAAIYHGRPFSTADLQGFYLGHKKENDVDADFKGEQVVVVLGGDRSEYESEKEENVYKIELKLRLKIRFKVWFLKTPKFKPKLKCDLKVPLMNKGKVSSVKFERTKCDFDW